MTANKYKTILQVAQTFSPTTNKNAIIVLAKVWACPEYAQSMFNKVDKFTEQYIKTELWEEQCKNQEQRSMLYGLQEAIMTNANKAIGLELWVASFIRDTYMKYTGSMNGLFEAIGYLSIE
jgi:hypothetical protein